MEKHIQQSIALAGMAQAAYLVNQLGQQGNAAQDKLNTCLNSLFVTKPESTLSIYGDLKQIKLGLNILDEVFGNESSDLKSPELMRYLISVIHLQGRLSSQPEMLARIGKELVLIEDQYGDSPYDFLDFPEILERLAELYQQTISTLPFRIQVKGKMQYLQNPLVANTIRASLLAAIRSAVLWQQLGGRRWHFLIYRKRIKRAVSSLLIQAGKA